MGAKAAEQTVIPGYQDDYDRLIVERARKYAAVRDERIALSQEERQAKLNLIDAMHEREKDAYVYRDVKVKLEGGKEQVKVVIGENAGAEGEEAEG